MNQHQCAQANERLVSNFVSDSSNNFFLFLSSAFLCFFATVAHFCFLLNHTSVIWWVAAHLKEYIINLDYRGLIRDLFRFKPSRDALEYLGMNETKFRSYEGSKLFPDLMTQAMVDLYQSVWSTPEDNRTVAWTHNKQLKAVVNPLTSCLFPELTSISFRTTSQHWNQAANPGPWL